jgi:hypothetical protein
MLSQFSYRKFDTMIQARCFLEGVELIPVNPAYTSTIGKVKFSYGYGLSTHMGAAMACLGPERALQLRLLITRPTPR